MKCSVCRTAPRRMRSKRPTGSLRGNTIPIITPTIRLRIWHQEKMKEINEAYATLMKGGRQQADAGSTGGQRSSAGSTSSPLYEIRRRIQLGDLDGAEAGLNAVSARTAEWYYLRGVIAQRRGWMDEAAQNFRIAVNMEPQNLEYRNALSSVGSGAYTYRQTQYSDGSDELCGLCSSLMCLNCLCGGCR